MNNNELLKEIISKSHLSKSKDLARQYWDSLDIDPFSLRKDDFLELRRHIQCIINKLSVRKGYNMIHRLNVKGKIEKDRNRISLRISGSYFDDHEGITFYRSDKLTGIDIGFCGELNGCNQTPFIQGFITWINLYLLKNDN